MGSRVSTASATHQVRSFRSLRASLARGSISTHACRFDPTPITFSNRYASGVQLDDTERRHATGPLRGAWFPVARFRTGGEPAIATARTVSVSNAALLYAYGGGDCGPGTSIELDVQVADAAPTDVIELRVRGQVVIATRRAVEPPSFTQVT